MPSDSAQVERLKPDVNALPTATLDSHAIGVKCPRCGNVVGMERILQSKEDSRGHCLQCHAWFLVELPKVKKKLIYIDQSLMSDLFRVDDGTPQWELVQRILRKLQRLKELQKVFLVVSDIHSAETSAIPEEYAGQRDSLWRFQNSLADGEISGNWHDVFVAQQRRALATPGMHECFPGVDIGLDDPHRWQVGIKVVLTNAWRGRLLRTSSPAPNLNDRYRQIITSQVDALGSSVEMRDTLGHVLSLWRKDLEEGIDAVRRLNRLWQSRDEIELLTPADLTVLSQSLASHFKGVVTEVIKGMDADAALDHWLAQLESGKNCAALRVRIAFEAARFHPVVLAPVALLLFGLSILPAAEVADLFRQAVLIAPPAAVVVLRLRHLRGVLDALAGQRRRGGLLIAANGHH